MLAIVAAVGRGGLRLSPTVAVRWPALWVDRIACAAPPTAIPSATSRPAFFTRARSLHPAAARCHRLRLSLSGVRVDLRVRRASSSSLGTADPAEHEKAGARQSASSVTGSLGVSGAAIESAAERRREGKGGADGDGETKGREAEAAHVNVSAEDGAGKQSAPIASLQPTAHPSATTSSVPHSSTPTSPSLTTPSPSPSTPTVAPPSHVSAPASLTSPAVVGRQQPASFLLPPVPADSPLLRGVLWFDCVYPMQAHWLDPRHLLASHNHEQLIPHIVPQDVEILSMIPRIKEGGVFVQFEARRGDAYGEAADVAEAVIRRLRAKPVRARFTTRPVHCHLVKGDPFLEDLLSRFPSARLKLEVKGSAQATGDLTLEHLFGELRAFGRINDLVLLPWVKSGAQRSASRRTQHFLRRAIAKYPCVLCSTESVQ